MATDALIAWLRDSDPTLRWQVERDLMREPSEVWEATRARIATEGFGARLLALQDPDGQWAGGAFFPADFDFHGPEAADGGQPWTATTWTLNSLREWGLDPAVLRERRTAELLAEHSRWEYENLPYWGGEVDCCINAWTVANGLWLGADIADIADITGIVDWFLEHQLPDGGWNCEWVEGSTGQVWFEVDAPAGLRTVRADAYLCAVPCRSAGRLDRRAPSSALLAQLADAHRAVGVVVGWMSVPGSSLRGVLRAFLFALDPTPAQERAFRSHCGAQRFAFNFGLALVRANRDQRAAERSYGIAEADLTPAVSWSAYGLRRAWNAAKHEVAPWWAENSKEAYSSGLANLAAALSHWSTSRSGTRAGHTMGFPRFKRRGRLSCRFTTGAFGLAGDRRHVRLPRIGVVRTHESTRTLARKLEAGTARIRSATLSWQRGRWHVSFSVELPDPEPAPRAGGRVVGVDLGIATLATLSTGERVPNRRRLDRELSRLRRAQRACARRRGPDRRTRAEPSNRWRKARARADRIHARVANLRRDDTHQLSTRLVRAHDVIVIEDLAVANMLRNKRLARHIAGAAWAEIRRQLTYKAQWAGVRLVVADRWFASSKTCSGCGTARAKLALSERTYACTACGLVLDRDLNAARNLAALAAADTTDTTDTGELRREQPDRTDVRPARPAAVAVGPLREESCGTQRHRREAVAR